MQDKTKKKKEKKQTKVQDLKAQKDIKGGFGPGGLGKGGLGPPPQ